MNITTVSWMRYNILWGVNDPSYSPAANWKHAQWANRRRARLGSSSFLAIILGLTSISSIQYRSSANPNPLKAQAKICYTSFPPSGNSSYIHNCPFPFSWSLGITYYGDMRTCCNMAMWTDTQSLQPKSIDPMVPRTILTLRAWNVRTRTCNRRSKTRTPIVTW